MTKLTTVIVDDERDSRECLQQYLAKYCPSVELVASCANIQEARVAIGTHKPQLVFLDIEMPFGNAFDLLEQLESIDFEIIFVTAFSQYAVTAFNSSAANYLLKPIDIDELIVAVEKASANLDSRDRQVRSSVLKEQLSGKVTRLILPLLDGFEVVEISDIVYCEAADNFTRFFMSSGVTHMICRKLKFYEDILVPHAYCRIHRSTLVNLAFVQRYVKGKGGIVMLRNGKELAVSQSKKGAFLEMMGLG
ncbi:MAG: LytR/AlgR family response regulator transcription factor [Saprospiraceae bacterium]